MTNIFVHRNDLRIKDNTGLFEAGRRNEVVPVYAIDPEFWNYYGDNRKQFILNNLEKLQEAYRERGSDLYIRHGSTQDIVREAIDEYGAKKVYFNRHYVPEHRDAERRLKEAQLDLEHFQGGLAVEPQQLESSYPSMSQFYDDWKAVDKKLPKREPENLKSFADRKFDSGTFNVDSSIELPPAGYDNAKERWEDFFENRIGSYKQNRDDLSKPRGVSRMSAYLANGIIGVREVLKDVNDEISSAEKSNYIRNVAKYRYELAWREFMYFVMYNNPETVKQNYREFENEIQWLDNEQELRAWKRGETGVPFVDAGMHQLKNEGYMHNRLRQNVASFLTKHLMIDWREGEEYFRKHLFDHDTANNVGGWQWSASTGTDTVPIRIFNPVKQGRKYDQDAAYIKKYVPELRDVPAEAIHNWGETDEKERKQVRREYDVDYPSPVVDINQRYHEGKQMFQKAIGK